MVSLDLRLACPRSYATEDNPDLLCEIVGKCDGTLYECCLWDKSIEEQMILIQEQQAEGSDT